MNANLSVRAYDASHGSHSHTHHQLLVGLEGTLEIEVQGLGQRIAPGDALLVPPGELHDFESRHGSRCLVLDTANPLWRDCAAQPHRPQQVAALARYLEQALQQPSFMALTHAPALLLDAWHAPSTFSRPRRAIDWQALAAWVHAHLDQSLNVADLAQHVHLSASQFAQRCHEAQGLGPLDWLRLQRLTHARQLRNQGLPVQEVARRAGYRSPSALTAALRRAGF
jgi:AraC-like DNA-binding protein